MKINEANKNLTIEADNDDVNFEKIIFTLFIG